MNSQRQSQTVNIRYNNFLTFNIRKLYQVLNTINEQASEVFYAVPFLLNVNTSQYPGFIKQPISSYGIYAYRFEPDVLKIIEKLFGPYHNKDWVKEKQTLETKPVIQSLFLMGSLGTIGHTKKSDFDYWVVIDELKTDGRLQAELTKKLLLIKQWAIEYANLEIHFFVITKRCIQKNNFGKVDNDSAGSALGKLLKDEFFRSSILITGKIPYFWITPDECTDKIYKSTIENINSSKACIPDRFIDMGNIYDIDKEEYYGALLWQMAKGLHSPYKSVIKMGLIHQYFFSSGPRHLLSNKIKKRIHSQKLEDSDFDPYLLMFDSVCSFYEQKKDYKALDILKKSFILKIDSHLKKEELRKNIKRSHRLENYKNWVIEKYLQKWEWDYPIYIRFHKEGHLSFSDNIELGKEIASFMMGVYKTIFDTLKQSFSGENKITGRDLTVLVKKIISQISPKKDKIPKLTLCTSENIVQKKIILNAVREDDKVIWRLITGNINQKDIITKNFKKGVLYASHSLFGLLAYLLTNRIIDKKTDILLYDKNDSVEVDLVKKILNKLYLFFLPSSSIVFHKNILDTEYIMKCFYTVNFTHPPKKADQFNEISVIYQNSMGEIFLKEFFGENAIDDSMQCIIMAPPPKISNFSDYFQVCTGTSLFSYIQKIDFTNRVNRKLLDKIGERRRGSRSKLDFSGSNKILEGYQKKGAQLRNNKLDYIK